ncbi:hypothetical protein B0I31_12824 [Saccharothrix carnea]|uniref:Uncharacterized protein n=1 Tax=Saccharothrix carnea TaxID=1280637 RepID=A0A2P8HEE3_SACCR|nr:hypothetical protein [Saccharothrix carnea]PSL44600.1 hypothetical protein B0I31_12824 [Saccharothrix carnea]
MKLDGVLAIREHWAAPDEPVLLCAGAAGASTRFDVPGLDWSGSPAAGFAGKALRGVAGFAGNVVSAVADDDLGARELPGVVVFGGSPEALAPGAALASRQAAVAWLVLTPHRLAWVAAVPEPVEPEPEKSLFDRVGDLARGARDAFAGKSPYPPHEPVPTVAITTVAELPRPRITGAALAERKLPRGSVPGSATVLRVSLVDGSGVDVLAKGRPEAAQRLLALVNA